MDDPTRGLLGSQPPDEPQSLETRPGLGPTSGAPGSDRPGQAQTSNPPGAPGDSRRPGHDAKFIGDAMRALYRTSATSIERGDATRVIGRTDSTRPMPPSPAHKPTSIPPGPRVDLTLWVVLALGLFAIAGVMLSSAF
jgi:hypothetical protein